MLTARWYWLTVCRVVDLLTGWSAGWWMWLTYRLSSIGLLPFEWIESLVTVLRASGWRSHSALCANHLPNLQPNKLLAICTQLAKWVRNSTVMNMKIIAKLAMQLLPWALAVNPSLIELWCFFTFFSVSVIWDTPFRVLSPVLWWLYFKMLC